ncbi:hypothetical protein Bca4012_005108 [Brassica carinata]
MVQCEDCSECCVCVSQSLLSFVCLSLSRDPLKLTLSRSQTLSNSRRHTLFAASLLHQIKQP